MTEAVWFPSQRGGAEHFPTWDLYCSAVIPPDGGSLLEVLSAGAKHGPGADNNRRAARRNPENPKNPGRLATADAQELPWVTFVLGSGCLSAADTIPGPPVADGIRSKLSESLIDVCDEFPDLTLDEVAVRFVELLALQKTEVTTAEEAFGAVIVRDNVEPPQLSALAALAAALATQFYAAALDATQHILERTDREEVRLDPRSQRGVLAQYEIVKPLRHVLAILMEGAEDTSTPSQQRALAELARAVDGSVATSRIRRLHVELLTSFAWYFFTERTRVYPSWSELMLLRSFDDHVWFAKEIISSSDASPRPRISRVSHQASWVRARIAEVTNESWKSRAERRGPTDRDAFYDVVAKVLRQQAEAILPRAAKPPLPTAFVSSFDLELEMALWAQGKPFAIVLPVFALDKLHRGHASLHWVWTTVTPSGITDEGEPKDLTGPRLELPPGLWNPDGWRVLVEGDLLKAISARPDDDYDGIPVVVRLTGSPLMAVPSVTSLRPTADTEALHHALLLDEYIAIHQASLDLATPGMNKEKNASVEVGNGLPAFLSQPDSGPSRFWMFLGAQLGDTAVRLRLTAQQLAYRVQSFQRNSEEGDNEAGNGDHAATKARTLGVLINVVSQASDRELFLWQDFDVVDGRPLDRIADFEKFHADLGVKLTELKARFDDVGTSDEVVAR